MVSISLYRLETGALVAPPGEVRIVSVDIVTGTIFAGNSTSPAPGTVLAAYDQIWQIDGTTAGLPNFLVHDGKIATITLDTSGVTLANSTFDIRLFDISVPGINGTFTTTFANNTGTTLQVLGNNGTGHVPEPSSVALAALAFAGLVACGLRRHRRKI